ILVMTTNAGAERMSRASMGFTRQDHSGEDLIEIQRLFSPEFRNRLDAIIHFKPLSGQTVLHVVNKFVLELEAQLAEKQVTIDLDDAARAWLAEHGHDPAMGARPMARLIQGRFKMPLANELLFGKLANGGHVRVSVDESGPIFEFQSRSENAPRATSSVEE